MDQLYITIKISTIHCQDLEKNGDLGSNIQSQQNQMGMIVGPEDCTLCVNYRLSMLQMTGGLGMRNMKGL